MTQAAAGWHEQERAPDQQLVEAAQAGSAEAFNVLIDRYYDEVTRYLARQTSHPDLGSDIAQETFLQAFRDIDDLPEDRPFAAWLFRIARNRMISAMRRRRLRSFVSLDWLAASGRERPPELHQEDQSVRIAAEDEVSRVLATLKPKSREVLVLTGLGFTIPEMADLLGIDHAAARKRVSRAKEEFRQRRREVLSGSDDRS